ncbi:MAG: hypothetical protein AABY22_18350, partial [Nanoarchaeota archaeon]
MLNKVKEFFNKKKQSLEEKKKQLDQQVELQKAKKFYAYIKAGSEFAKFIVEDLKRQENGMNRQQRRRFEK